MFYKDWRPQDMLSVVQDSEASATRRQGLAALTSLKPLFPDQQPTISLGSYEYLRALSGVCLVVWKINNAIYGFKHNFFVKVFS